MNIYLSDCTAEPILKIDKNFYEYTKPLTDKEKIALNETLIKTIQSIMRNLHDIANDNDPIVISSAIGNLSVNSTGMRRAVDEISRLTAENKRLKAETNKKAAITDMSIDEIEQELNIIDKKFEDDTPMQPMSSAQMLRLTELKKQLQNELSNRTQKNGVSE